LRLLNANDFVRVSITGSFCGSVLPFLTVFRDSKNLGDSVGGLLSGVPASATLIGVEGTGITTVDSPNDTDLHTYQVYLRTFESLGTFPCYTPGFLLLEEISQ